MDTTTPFNYNHAADDGENHSTATEVVADDGVVGQTLVVCLLVFFQAPKQTFILD